MRIHKTAGGLLIVAIMTLIVVAQDGWAWSEQTHEVISRRAADVSVLSTGYLKSLGFVNLDVLVAGLDFDSNQQTLKIREWIAGGARFEDDKWPIVRSLNHFHHPFLAMPDWNVAGLADLRTGESAALWAQDAQNNPSWAWSGVRSAYYQAMTRQAKADRENWFAHVFAGLGHVIHLVQDMSQPAHVRNDAHLLDGFHVEDGMETWAFRTERDFGLISAIAGTTPVFPSLALTNVGSTGGQFLGPISEFWDADLYNGWPETKDFANLPSAGLSEYTNANYFSEDTINSPHLWHQFPYPSVNINDYRVCWDWAPPGSLAQRRWYVSRTPVCPSNPAPGNLDHFLSQSVVRDIFGLQPFAITPALQMDDRVHEDYSRALIPRAVGYSAKLIDYFFRGEITVEVVDPTHVRVVNGSNEPLNQGTIEIFYDTKQAQNRVFAGNYTLPYAIAPGQATDSIVITPPPTDPADPNSNLTPGRYGAVFQGTLGLEQNAVIGTSRFAWQENWDHDLITVPHNWYQTTLDPYTDPPSYGGERTATLVDAATPPSKRLRVRNFRPAGVPGDQLGEITLFQMNATQLGRHEYNYPYGVDPSVHYDAFPIALLPDTELQIKVDTLTASFPTPAQQCLAYGNWQPWHNGAVQNIEVWFNYGDYRLELSVLGQQRDTRKVGPSDGLILLTVGQDQRINLRQALQDSGVPVDQIGLAITSVLIEQELMPPCETTTIPQEQILEIDYLRFVDVPSGTP